MIPLLTKMIRTYIKFLLTTRKGKIYAFLLIVIIYAQFSILPYFCLYVSETGMKWMSVLLLS